MGGTLILPSGLPFYFEIKVDGKGGHQLIQVNDPALRKILTGRRKITIKSGAS